MEVATQVSRALRKLIDTATKNGGKSGIIDNLNGTMDLVQKILRSDDPKTIGFFGAQKRGKSSLINRLIGCDLLPVGPCPLTSVVVELHQDDTLGDGKFRVEIVSANGRRECAALSGEDALRSAKGMIEKYGSRRGNMDADIETIYVYSKFPNSKILKDGGILVDTPGAESAFEKTSDEDNRKDTERAIKKLKNTQIVIFVERADIMQSENSAGFFKEKIKDMRPLCVVNWKDAFQLDSHPAFPQDASPNLVDVVEIEKQRCLRKIMLDIYDATPGRVLCVSSKEAKSEDSKVRENSNLPELEKRILDELENLNPEIGLVTCLSEIEKSLSQLEQEKPEMAREVFSEAKTQFYNILQSENSEISEKAKKIYDHYNR